MEKLKSAFQNWWDTLTIGPAPEIHVDHLVESASNSSGLKWKITYRVNKIIKDHGEDKHKFGKSGHPPYRVTMEDYRSEPYTKMFLLYQSTSADEISQLEVHYIKKYKKLKLVENKSETPNHKMVSYEGKYYLYLVV
jgi:hypothetical protein